jgi:hypothetical protein
VAGTTRIRAPVGTLEPAPPGEVGVHPVLRCRWWVTGGTAVVGAVDGLDERQVVDADDAEDGAMPSSRRTVTRRSPPLSWRMVSPQRTERPTPPLPSERRQLARLLRRLEVSILDADQERAGTAR